MKRFITNQGVKGVENFGEEVTAKIISGLLTEHRNKLILQANAALENYVECRFHKFPTVSQVRFIRMLLEELKCNQVRLQDVPEILDEIQQTDLIALSDEPFERQIDEQISRILVGTDTHIGSNTCNNWTCQRLFCLPPRECLFRG
ncbi:hypothetical protein [Dawidia soli]|uniref:Uncharacterized protein n=1 Tax=Dawidia soli TaxID=2782352 RepID=A0AAP2GKC7_9BACT|nr:hypothetical protein [Dawidia soli]MBT1688898.1 hypothetical protein [Dawidia soli]